MSASANPSVEAAATTSSAAFTELRQEGNEQFRQKQFGLAIASYTAISLAGDFIAASNAAEAFLCLHQPEDAEKHCRRALALNSNVTTALFSYLFSSPYSGLQCSKSHSRLSRALVAQVECDAQLRHAVPYMVYIYLLRAKLLKLICKY